MRLAYHAGIHLVCTNVSVCARVCFACVRYRSGKNNYVYGYVYMCMFAFATANQGINSKYFLKV